MQDESSALDLASTATERKYCRKGSHYCPLIDFVRTLTRKNIRHCPHSVGDMCGCSHICNAHSQALKEKRQRARSLEPTVLPTRRVYTKRTSASTKYLREGDTDPSTGDILKRCSAGHIAPSREFCRVARNRTQYCTHTPGSMCDCFSLCNSHHSQ
jgi:hypothetical protein